MRAQVVVQIVLAMAIGHAVAVGQSPPPRDSVPPFIARGRVVTADGVTLRRVRVSVQGGERSAPTFTGEDGRFELIVPAVNRRGKSIECRVSVSPLRQQDRTVDGAILLMEEKPPDAAA